MELILEVKNGNESAFEKLADMYSPLISSVCFKYRGLISEDALIGSLADLRQELIYSLYRAALTYDTEQKKVTFGRYAKRCLENCAVSYIRKVKSTIRRESRASERLKREHNFESFFPGAREDQKSEILELVSGCLSSYEYMVFTKYAEGFSAAEIARELSKDEKSVNNAVFRSKAKIRKFYKK